MTGLGQISKCQQKIKFLSTLIPLLRISIFCHFGSTSFVLPIRPKDGILNRGIRVTVHGQFSLLISAKKGVMAVPCQVSPQTDARAGFQLFFP